MGYRKEVVLGMKFKVGDKVKVYDFYYEGKGEVLLVTDCGVLLELIPSDGKVAHKWFHEKQCRLLKTLKRVKISRKDFLDAVAKTNDTRLSIYDEAHRITLEWLMPWQKNWG